MSLLKRGLIVSCQAVKGEPLYGYGIMHLFAKAAKEGGATGIRALAPDVDSIKDEVNLPVIGLVKEIYEDSELYITPTKAEVDVLLNTKCDVICMDATLRSRPGGITLDELYAYARENAGGREIMATLTDSVLTISPPPCAAILPIPRSTRFPTWTSSVSVPRRLRMLRLLPRAVCLRCLTWRLSQRSTPTPS